MLFIIVLYAAVYRDHQDYAPLTRCEGSGSSVTRPPCFGIGKVSGIFVALAGTIVTMTL